MQNIGCFHFQSIVYLEPKGTEFEDKLHGEEDGKNDVENIEELSVEFRLLVKFHGKTQSVDEDHDKYGVFKQRRGNKGPKLVLDGILGNIPTHGFRIECKLYAVSLKKKKKLPKITNEKCLDKVPDFCQARSFCKQTLPLAGR